MITVEHTDYEKARAMLTALHQAGIEANIVHGGIEISPTNEEQRQAAGLIVTALGFKIKEGKTEAELGLEASVDAGRLQVTDPRAYIMQMLEVHQNSYTRLAQIVPVHLLPALLQVWAYIGEESDATELAELLLTRCESRAEAALIAPKAIREIIETKRERYSVSGMSYADACAVEKALRDAGLDANISVGAVAVYLTLAEIERANEVIAPWGHTVYLGPSSLTGLAYMKPAAYRAYLHRIGVEAGDALMDEIQPVDVLNVATVDADFPELWKVMGWRQAVRALDRHEGDLEAAKADSEGLAYLLLDTFPIVAQALRAWAKENEDKTL